LVIAAIGTISITKRFLCARIGNVLLGLRRIGGLSRLVISIILERGGRRSIIVGCRDGSGRGSNSSGHDGRDGRGRGSVLDDIRDGRSGRWTRQHIVVVLLIIVVVVVIVVDGLQRRD
jgi:hypothetical protein